jgi:hypothetical protein
VRPATITEVVPPVFPDTGSFEVSSLEHAATIKVVASQGAQPLRVRSIPNLTAEFCVSCAKIRGGCGMRKIGTSLELKKEHGG